MAWLPDSRYDMVGPGKLGPRMARYVPVWLGSPRLGRFRCGGERRGVFRSGPAPHGSSCQDGFGVACVAWRVR
jgi:hypothetical protein